MTEHHVILIRASELAELQRDADRYRWLRQQEDFAMSANYFLPVEAPYVTPGTSLTEVDAAIDAAMQANK
jgi:hypothetical protein